MVRCLEGTPACEKPSVGMVLVQIWPAVTTASASTISDCRKTQDGLTNWYQFTQIITEHRPLKNNLSLLITEKNVLLYL